MREGEGMLSDQAPVLEWARRRVLVTGGASFIGSHLVDALLTRGATIRVIDDLSSGAYENIAGHLVSGDVEFVQADLREPGVAMGAVDGMEVVFHLAADHGGRGYVDLHQAACSSNVILDGLVFDACRRVGVGKVVYASSGCVYPNYLQKDPQEVLYLSEEMVGPPYDADNLYGWAKLMGEMTLQAYYREYGMRSATCRYFTVYGRRGRENHAVMAMVARAFVRQAPFVVWGTGDQVRNWTHVSDIVAGTILAAEIIDDATAVNLGTRERVRVIDAAHEILRYTGHGAEIALRPDLPTGPLNRVANNELARRLLGWEPRVSFRDGLQDTIEWYFATKNCADVAVSLDRRLLER